MRSEELRHNISILWHSGLLDMFFHRSPKTSLKKHSKLNSLQHFKVEIPGNLQKWKFSFSQFFRNFVLNKISFNGTLGFLTCFSVDPHKPHWKIPKTTSLYCILKLIFPKIFKNEFSQYSQKIFFRLIPRFLWSPHKLLRHFEISQ